MNENEIMENVEENVLETIRTDGFPDSDLSHYDDWISDVGIGAGSGNLSESDDISISLDVGELVDNNDSLYNPMDSETDMEVQSEIETLVSHDYTEVLQSIDTKLSLIIFLMLVFWCIKHIRIAVRSFTGRGIEL